MIDLIEWRWRLNDLRENGGSNMSVVARNELIDGLRKLLRPYVGGLFAYPNIIWHPEGKRSEEESLAWLKGTTKVIDFVRVMVTAYLTDGEVASWKPNNQPETYYLVAATLRGLSPAETIDLLRRAYYGAKKEWFDPERYGEIYGKLTIAR